MEVQQLYERPHDPITASLAREFGPLDEQQEWQADLLSLLCKPLEICRELLLYAVPKKVGPSLGRFTINLIRTSAAT